MWQSCLCSFNFAQELPCWPGDPPGKFTVPLNGVSEEVLYKYYVVIIIIIKHEQKFNKIGQVKRPDIPDTWGCTWLSCSVEVAVAANGQDRVAVVTFATAEVLILLLLHSNAWQMIVTARIVNPAAFHLHLGHSSAGIPQRVAVRSLARLWRITDLRLVTVSSVDKT